jgi:hypothetical protein
VASDIPVHREIYAAGAFYFDCYDAQKLRDTLGGLLSDGSYQAINQAKSAAKTIIQKFSPGVVMARWGSFFGRATGTKSRKQ